MKLLFQRINNFFRLLGFDFQRTIVFIFEFPHYLKDLHILKKQEKFAATKFAFGRMHPCLLDRFSHNGVTRGHYFYQDLLVAHRIYLNSPVVHADVGSRVDGFVAHVASYRKLDVFDIRPPSSAAFNIRFVQADLMTDLNDWMIDYCDSLSCLHAMEHFGLGRYGDPINYDGYLKGLANLYKILKKGGKFYFSVPIGPQRIEFNAHRVFSMSYLVNYFSGKYRIDCFSFVDDRGALHENVSIGAESIKNNFNCFHGCAIFEMTKL